MWRVFQSEMAMPYPGNSVLRMDGHPDRDTGRKSKVWFGQPDKPVFAFAGIWRPADSGSLMALLTCEPNTLVGAVHPEAMPVILEPSSFDVWLKSERADACALARPFSDERMVQFAD